MERSLSDLLSLLLAELPTALFSVIGTVAITLFSTAPRLRVFFTPLAEFDPAKGSDAPGLNQVFRIESLLVVNNNWTKVVSDIEITLAYKPATYSIKPPVSNTWTTHPNNQWTLKLDKVNPREQLKIDVAYFGVNAPAVMHIRSSEGAKTVEPAVYNSVLPIWRRILMLCLASIGLFFVASVFWRVLKAALVVAGTAA